MGNSKSVVSQGVKQQASGDGSKSHSLYKLINMQGGGELVELMKKASRTKDYREIDEKIRTGVKPFLYNGGEGELVPIADLVKIRNKDRQSLKVEEPKPENDGVAMVNLVTDQHGNHVSQKPRKKYRFLCWQVDKIGAVGETALHLCLLNATSTHADLAKRLLRIFPNLIKDIYLSEEYYGESILHMAIVNEDPALVKFFLDRGADVNDRCCGSFFCPDDQKDSRRDHPDSEYVHVCKETSYEGYTYWGEYALGFAACLGQEECVRLLIAKGADPNLQDNNGNTVLHMLVIHDKKPSKGEPLTLNQVPDEFTGPKEMFDLIYHLGGRLDIKNRQGLTPLTLAAKLARKDMYEHILEIEREVYWVYGDVTCAGYPLQDIDTISSTGEINKDSALFHIVQGEQMGHLDMLDGIVSQLLQEKWKTFARFRFYRRFAVFILYFVIFAAAFLLRPGKDQHPTYRLTNVTVHGNITFVNNTVYDPCYLIRGNTAEDIARYVLECLTLFGACNFLILAANEIYNQNCTIFFMTLRAAPTKSLFLLSCILVVLMIPGRAACNSAYEDVMGVLAILFTAPYFLFFCRGFTMVGPFVVMIYKMIKGDLLRFFTIYVVFLIGFSQAMFVMFRREPEEDNIFSHPIEAMMGMFIMSLGEFADIYEQFDSTPHPVLGKIVFVLHMVLVTLLLVNMLIAMMGNTYTLVSQTQKEYLRQWAKIVLVMEQTVSTGARRNKQMAYSQPMADGRRALVTRWHQTESEREEMKRLREMHRLHKKNIMRRKASRKGLRVEVAPTAMQNV